MSTTPDAGRGLQRAGGLALLLGAGILSLPAAAALFDDQGSENVILPAQLLGMAALGALVGAVLPGLSGSPSRSKRLVVGAAIGVGMALLGVVLFFLLLSGFDGA
jgi:hypothetical protein